MEADWLTTLKPSYTARENNNYKGSTARSLEQLLHEKRSEENIGNCSNCGTKFTRNLTKIWLGYAYAPDVLTFAFDRSNAKKYRVTLPLEHDFTNFVVAMGRKTKYRLVTVIKKMKSGDHAAYVHAEDGKWWRCISDEVRRAEIGDWQNDKFDEAELAIYEKLE